jgi:hypothetical protein
MSRPVVRLAAVPTGVRQIRIHCYECPEIARRFQSSISFWILASPMSDIYNFGANVLPVVLLARDFATRPGSGEVAPEHLWLGVVHQQPALVTKLRLSAGAGGGLPLTRMASARERSNPCPGY